MVILVWLIASGCSRSAPADESSAGDEDTAPADPCEVPPEPSDYVNDEFAGADCTFTGFPVPGFEMASVRVFLPDMRMQYWAPIEDRLPPNRHLFVEWYEERGANPYPSESILEGTGWGDAPVNVFVVDCPTKEFADCVYYFSTSGRVHYSKGGLCPPDWHDSRLVGFVDQVVLAQADVVVDKGTSEWVEGGDTWCLPRYDFDLYLD